jgi:hypothetical protein
MRALMLDFQPRRRASPLGWSLLASGVVLVLTCIVIQQHLSAEAEQQQGHLQTAQRVLTGDTGSKVSLTPAQIREQAQNLAEMRKVSQQLRRPWEQLFATLEAMPRDNIALLTLTPDARKGQLRISAEARDLDAMLDFHRASKPATSCPMCRCSATKSSPTCRSTRCNSTCRLPGRLAMQIPRLIVHEYLQSLGVPGLAGLAMLVLALTYGLAGLLPDWQSVQQLSQQTREARAYLAKVEDGTVAAPVVPQRQLDDFRSKLPTQPQATVAIDKIYALAAQERITLARGEYSWASIRKPTWRATRSCCRCGQLPATAALPARLARPVAGGGAGGRGVAAQEDRRHRPDRADPHDPLPVEVMMNSKRAMGWVAFFGVAAALAWLPDYLKQAGDGEADVAAVATPAKGKTVASWRPRQPRARRRRSRT